MKLKIKINQTASLLAGFEAPNSTEVIDIPVNQIPADVRAFIVPYWNLTDGTVTAKADGEYHSPIATMPLTVESAIAALTALKAECDSLVVERQAKTERTRIATLEALRDQRTRTQTIHYHDQTYVEYLPDWPWPYDSAVAQSIEAQDWKASLEAQNKIEKTTAQNRHAAMVAEKERPLIVQRKAEDAYLTDFARKVSANVSDQWNEGLLDRNELIDMLTADVIKGLGLTPADITTCESRECECRTSETNTLSVDAYAQWLKLKAILPEDTSVGYRLIRECDSSESRYYADVVMPVGPFQVRVYALPLFY